MSKVIFRPADALDFLPIEMETERLSTFCRSYDAHRRKGATVKEAFYRAWKRAHRSGEEILPSYGADRFWTLFVNMLNRTDMYLEYVVGEFLWPKRMSLRTYNKSANEIDPVRLMNLWMEMDQRNDPLGRQAAFEARRNFAIASQFAKLELADPDEWISHDVVTLENISEARLFAADSATIYGVFRLNVLKYSRLIEEPRITFERDEAINWMEEAKTSSERHQRVVIDEYPCRVVNHNGSVYYVLCDDPRKKPFARLMKYERESRDAKPGERVVAKDARRGLYINIAVREHGHLRIAGREDARELFTYVCEKMWHEEPLRIDHIRNEEVSSKKKHRHPDYWDVKLIGSIQREDGDRIVESFVEQKVTTLSDGINEAYATDNLNHGIRRGEQLMGHVHAYWPKEIFGVDWESGDVTTILAAYWKERFSL